MIAFNIYLVNGTKSYCTVNKLYFRFYIEWILRLLTGMNTFSEHGSGKPINEDAEGARANALYQISLHEIGIITVL